ncbi:rCG27564 [Rattus norvegicus]|uniref:RCG27564 n=1 Tax=Rattus norvegicus TaxID=10116 RepID=A6K7B4_RAT|nr:rCG27564 [Rattus norvegicus]
MASLQIFWMKKLEIKEAMSLALVTQTVEEADPELIPFVGPSSPAYHHKPCLQEGPDTFHPFSRRSHHRPDRFQFIWFLQVAQWFRI